MTRKAGADVFDTPGRSWSDYAVCRDNNTAVSRTPWRNFAVECSAVG